MTKISSSEPVSIGKVRDMYDAGSNLLVVASDRISVFDVVLGSPVPGKGKVLTAMTEFWLKNLLADVSNHLVSTDVADFPDDLQGLPDLAGRGMLVKRAKMLPIECIVRGYLYGSVTKEYQQHGTATGIPLPAGLVKASELPEPIFTPSTKADLGEHDQNIDANDAKQVLTAAGFEPRLVDTVATKSIDIYQRAWTHAKERGVIIADTKFEWGLVGGVLTLCDEVLTPDSSRFWELDSWEPGEEPISLDKQFVRNYYDEHYPAWRKKPRAPAPPLPDDIIEATREKYLDALELITAAA